MRLVFLVVLMVSGARPQPTQPLQFDSASIRPVPKGRVIFARGPNGPGRITYTDATIGTLIAVAYQVDGDQILGESGGYREDLLAGDRFVLTATFPPATAPSDVRIMLQNLLADRFHLVLHHETRDFPAYNLELLPGPLRLRPFVPDPNAPVQVGRSALEAGQPGFYFSGPAASPMVHVVGHETIGAFAADFLPFLWRLSENARDSLDSGDVPLRRVVIQKPRFFDRTGLKGMYEFSFDFEGSPMRGFRQATGGPSVSEALERQLAIKLVKSKKVPIDVLIIEHVDRIPTEN